MILVCIMEKQDNVKGSRIIAISEIKVYFNTETLINLESTDVKVILSKMIKEILEKISMYQMGGSGWYFKEVTSLEIHIVDYKPMKGYSYIPLPDFLMKKKSIINIQTKIINVFFGLFSVIFILFKRMK